MNDESLMYFGQHKGDKLANLPPSYCRWLITQDWIEDHPALYSYLLENEETFYGDD